MLKLIFKQHRGKITGALTLVVIEAALYISEPYIFGMTIDHVTDTQADQLPHYMLLYALLPWIIVYTLNFITGSWRRIYDTKTYTAVFADVAGQVAKTQFDLNIETSKIVARSNMARHLVEFFEVSVPEFVEQVITVLGTIVALSLLDVRMTIACVGMLLPYIIINRRFMKRIARVQVDLNNEQENEVLTFVQRDHTKVKEFYQGLAIRQTRISSLSAANFTIFKILTMIIFIGILYIALDMDEFSVGEIYSVVAYIWAFIGASEYIPYLSEKWTALRDVARRLTLTSGMLQEGLAPGASYK